jgi:trehalose/maltose hydrolase-like predicted phosphorylase
MAPKPEWQSTADSMNMPYDYSTGTHPEYDGYDGRTVKQADVVLLGYPLMMEMSADDRRRDLDYYGDRLDPGAPCMSWSMHAVGYLEVGDVANAEQSFARSYSNSHAPFKVWSENVDGGCVGFLTGLGGFLQTMMFGLGGLRILSDQLVVNPTLIGGLNNIVIRGVHYHGAVLRISFNAGQLTIFVESAPPAPAAVHLIDGAGNDDMVAQSESRDLPLGKVSIRVG